MEFLSLNETPAPRPARLTRAEAIGISVLAHAALVLLMLHGERVLPEGLRRWLAPRPAVVTQTSPPEAAPPPPADAARPPEQPKPAAKMPLKFAYVKVPDDAVAPKNPLAPLLSDKDRRARQEVPTPADAKLFTRDPHSKGDTINRVRPDPTVPEGPDAEDPIGSDPPAPAEPTRTATRESPRPGPGEGDGADGPGSGREESSDEATIAHGDLVPPQGALGGSVPPPASGQRRVPATGGDRAGSGGGRTTASGKPGTEFKFQFNNPGWVRDRAYGTMSFDTQGFPWGDYARRLYVAIRNSWLERIPLAARENMAGYTCQHFTIARDGTVTSIDILRPSRIPPFTKAATDAINAASKVPALPEDFPKEEEGVTFCFYYNMYPGEAE